MRSEDYVVIQGWMHALPLTDKQRLVYAMIWGYSRDGHSRMRGSAKYIAEWAGCHPKHAQKIIRSLEEMGLIAHEVLAWSNGKIGGVVSEFWAILPEEADRPEPGTRGKINWIGKARKGYRPDAVTPLPPRCGNPHNDSNSIHTLSCGGSKNSARSRAKKTTTTGFLFEENETGLTPGISLPLPFSEEYFVEAWEKLLRQPKWAEKTPEALEIVLRRFDDTGDPVLCAFCCLKAIEREWPTITDPSGIGLQDQDQLMAFADQVRAQKEGETL